MQNLSRSFSLLLLLALLPMANAANETVLIANDGAAYDHFGFSLALDGNRLAVGAPGASVNGEQGRGAVYLFERTGNQWQMVAKLVALDGNTEARFGESVSLCGGTLVVGAPRASAGNGEQGAVYVFERQEGSWIQAWKLAASDGASGEAFGASVSVRPNRLVVGAPRAAAPSPSSGYPQGAAYVFEKHGQVWQEQARLADNEGGFLDLFGSAVALSGNRIAVAAEGHSDYAGGVYLFTRNGDDWQQTGFHAPGPHTNGSSVGAAIVLDQSLLGIGAPWSGSNETVASGAMYVLAVDDRDSSSVTLTAGDWSAGAGFGASMALHGNRLVAGAPWIGKAYLFERDTEGDWHETMRLPGTSARAGFGTAVAVSGSVLVVGNDLATVEGREVRGRVHLYTIE